MRHTTALQAVLPGVALIGVLLYPGTDGVAQDADSDDDRQSLDIEFSSTLTLEKRLGGCTASLQIEYWQKGDKAEVKSLLSNPDCPASSGDYVIVVSYRNDEGERIDDEHPEQWSRDDANPVETTRLYHIGDDVDLLRVRSRRLSCSCAVNAGQPGS